MAQMPSMLRGMPNGDRLELRLQLLVMRAGCQLHARRSEDSGAVPFPPHPA
jgi:hypothetical protein